MASKINKGEILAKFFDDGEYTALFADGAVSAACGYAAGQQAYAVYQNGEAVTVKDVEKNIKVLEMAAQTGCPVVTFYNSVGAKLAEGLDVLTASAKLNATIAKVSGVIPQIAVVTGVCGGTSALSAANADVCVMAEDAELFFTAPFTSAAKGDKVPGAGTAEAAAKAAVAAAQKQKAGELPHVFTGSVEHAIAHIEESIQGKVDDRFLRWYAVKLFERDDKVMEELKLDKALVDHIDEHIKDCEKEMDDDAESIITNQRYSYINGVVDKAVKKKARVEHLTASDKIDQIVTNRILALPIFALVMFLMYSLSMGTSIADGGWAIGTFATDWTNDVLFGEIVPGALGGFLESIGVAGWLYGLIMDGIVAGVGAVLGFVPQMLVLFFLLSILEDVGYMSRVAFIMDRIFRRFGLSGKSFIPILVGTGCGVPGVMASRTIENERDRRMTIMTTCFIPCGAKMPIIGLIAGALFGGSSWVATSAYFIGFAAIIISGIILKKTKLFAGDPAPFVMELPAYHVPAWGNVLRATWERGWSFIKRAGTVILAATIILWFLQGFGFENGAFTMVEDQDNSILAIVASAISWIFIPQGFGNWRATVASISGLIAKENVVGTFGVLYHYADELSDNGDEIWPEVAASFTALSAYSFMIFNLLCAPCFAAMGAIKREMNNGKWTAIAIGYMCALAYCAALVVYQIGGLITGEVGFNFFTIVAIVIFAAFLYLMFRPNKYIGDNEVKIDVSKIK